MATLQDIEEAIAKLSPDDLARLGAWLEEFDAAVWDRQFDEDAQSGRLAGLAREALAEFRAGRCKEL